MNKLLRHLLLALLLAYLFYAINAYAADLRASLYVSDQTKQLTADKVKREYVVGETAEVVVMANGFSVTSSSQVDLTTDIALISPIGSVVTDQKMYSSLKMRFDGDIERSAAFFPRVLTIKFTKNDPVGMYVIRATVRDGVAGVSNQTETTVLLFDTLESKRLIMGVITNEQDIVALWEEYSRGKNPWAIKSIIKALTIPEVMEKAKTLLIEKAKMNPEVLAICEQSLFYTTGELHKELADVLKIVTGV